MGRGALHGESVFRQKVTAVAKEANPELKLAVFNGGISLAKQVSLFQSARAVVGIHGGALTNILFCRSSVDIFEIGFSSPLAGHYRHLATTMGLRIHLLPLVADERGLGAREVKMQDMEASVVM